MKSQVTILYYVHTVSEITKILILAWSKGAWDTAQSFESGRAYRSNTVCFKSRLNLQQNVFLIKVPVASTKYCLLCPVPWDESDEDNYFQVVANIISLHHLMRQVHGKSVKQMKTSIFQLINQKLNSVITSGERSWTAPMMETSRHMKTWNAFAIAATQPTPTLPNGKVLKWLGGIRFMHLVDPQNRLIEITDESTDYLTFNQESYKVPIESYGHSIKKYI